MPNFLTKFLRPFQTQASADVNSLYELTEDVLKIVVLDAEKLMQAQLQSHLSTDQRGYAIATLLSAIATATTSGFFGLLQGSTPANTGAILALTIGLWLAALAAIFSIWPRPYCFPGNEPKNWLPSTWPKDKDKTTKRASFEQAKILQSQITQNQNIAFKKAILQIASLAIALLSTVAFAFISA